MIYQGALTKMQTKFENPIQYYLVFDKNFLNLNLLLGEKIEIEFQGYQCLNCGKAKKIFRQGFCYDCFMKSPAVGDWIMKPELSTAHLDIEDRDLEYEKRVQLQPHVVYLALSSEVKVGVTRKTQVPTRWIDQGAVQALVLAQTPNRHIAGVIERALMAHVADKTNWQPMLKGEITYSNLVEEKQRLAQLLHPELRQYVTEHRQITEISYPQLVVPSKISSATFDKTALVEGQLIGIKGQYLYFEGGTVLNIRRHTGYSIEISASE